MLAKSHRLNLKKNFRWVASGRSKTTPFFKLFYKFGDNPHPMVGVSIVSANFKKSTSRNLVKRLVFQIVQDNMKKLPKNINLVIMPKAQIIEAGNEDLVKSFQDAISSL